MPIAELLMPKDGPADGSTQCVINMENLNHWLSILLLNVPAFVRHWILRLVEIAKEIFNISSAIFDLNQLINSGCLELRKTTK